jgi:hypothetical protein
MAVGTDMARAPGYVCLDFVPALADLFYRKSTPPCRPRCQATSASNHAAKLSSQSRAATSCRRDRYPDPRCPARLRHGDAEQPYPQGRFVGVQKISLPLPSLPRSPVPSTPPAWRRQAAISARLIRRHAEDQPVAQQPLLFRPRWPVAASRCNSVKIQFASLFCDPTQRKHIVTRRVVRIRFCIVVGQIIDPLSQCDELIRDVPAMRTWMYWISWTVFGRRHRGRVQGKMASRKTM